MIEEPVCLQARFDVGVKTWRSVRVSVRTMTGEPACLQGQLTVANGVLFGTTSSGDDSLTASLFALNVTNGVILTAVTLNNTLVQNGPSIVDNVLYQGAGECCFETWQLSSCKACMQLHHDYIVVTT